MDVELNWVLVVTLVIITFFAIKGWRQGILGMVFSLLAWVFVIAFMYFATPTVESSLLNGTQIYDAVYEKVEKHVREKAAEDTQANVGEWYNSLMQGLPSGETREVSENLQQFNNTVDLSGLLNNGGISADKVGGTSGLMAVGDGQVTVLYIISNKITLFIIHCIAVVATFMVAEIVIFVLSLIVKAIGRMPVIRPTNLMLGVIAGAAEGFLVVWVLFYIVALASTTAFGQETIAAIYENPFLITLYENNLIMALI